MADFDKWQRAVNEAGNLRVQRDYVQRAYSAGSAERDALSRGPAPNPLVLASIQARMAMSLSQVEAFDARIQAAELEAAREEPDLVVKRDNYCAQAARAHTVPGYTPLEVARLDYQCRIASALVTSPNTSPSTNNTTSAQQMPEGVPATTPTTRNYLPIALVALAALAGGAYLWSQQASAPR